MSQDIVGANANGLLWWLYRATAEARCSPLKCSSFWPQQHSNLQPAGNVCFLFVCFFHPIRHKLTLKQKKRLNFWNLDFVLASLPSSCLFFKGLAEICMLCKHQQRGVKCNDELAPTEGQSWYYTPSPTHPQCPSVYKKQTGNKKIEEKKKRKPPTPQSGLAARHWLQVCACACLRVRISVCAAVAARVSENMRGLVHVSECVCVWMCVHACWGSMGVRGTPSISSPGQTPLLQDSRCSSSAERRKQNKITHFIKNRQSERSAIRRIWLTATSSRLLWWSLTDRPLSCCCSCPTPWLLRSREGMNQSWSSSSNISWKQRSKNSCSNSSSSTCNTMTQERKW